MAIQRFIILAATCVFAKQSLGPILCGRHQLKGACPSHLPPAPLIPKLRGHFAEFLFHGSLEHLRLLASPTCVGLRYGHYSYSHTRLFLAASSKALDQINLALGVRSHLQEGGFAYLPRLRRCIGTSCTRRLSCFRVPPHGQTQLQRHANIDAFPIVYGSRPRLRGRLTRSG